MFKYIFKNEGLSYLIFNSLHNVITKAQVSQGFECISYWLQFLLYTAYQGKPIKISSTIHSNIYQHFIATKHQKQQNQAKRSLGLHCMLK